MITTAVIFLKVVSEILASQAGVLCNACGLGNTVQDTHHPTCFVSTLKGKHILVYNSSKKQTVHVHTEYHTGQVPESLYLRSSAYILMHTSFCINGDYHMCLLLHIIKYSKIVCNENFTGCHKVMSKLCSMQFSLFYYHDRSEAILLQSREEICAS